MRRSDQFTIMPTAWIPRAALLAAASRALLATLTGLLICGNSKAQPVTAPSPVDPAAALDDRPWQLSENTNAAAEGDVGDWKDPAEFIRSHWVRLTAAGELRGQIQTIDPESGEARGTESLTVELYQEGQVKGQAMTEADGSFTISGLQPGVYALIARGETGFLAYGLQLLPSLDQARLDAVTRLAQAPIAKPVLEIRSAAVPPTFRQIKTILEENYSEMRSFYVPEEAYKPFLAAATERQEAGWQSEEGPDVYRGQKQLATADTDPAKTVGATTVDLHPVLLSDNNIMYGRLNGIDAATGRPRNVAKTKVYVIRNDRLVTSTEVDERGYFKVVLRRPAVYALVAAGEDGFGAIAFRAIKRPEPAAVSRRPGNYHRLIRLTGGLLQENDQDLLPPLPLAQDERAPVLQVPDETGLGNELACPVAMALIDDPDTIAAAVRKWTAAQAAPAGGMFDAGLAGPTTAAPLGPMGGAPGGMPGGGVTTSGGYGPSVSGGGGLLNSLAVAGIVGAAVGAANSGNPEIVSPFAPPSVTTPPPNADTIAADPLEGISTSPE